MSFAYRVETSGLEEVKRAIDALGLRPEDTLPERHDAAEEMVYRTHQRFATGTAPDGSSWKPSQRAEREGGQTLLDHGVLRDSVNFEATADGDLEGWTNDIRAAVHQEGKTITPKNGEWLIFPGADGHLVMVHEVHMPERRFLDFNDDDIEMVSEKMLTGIERRFDRGGTLSTLGGE